MVLTQKSLQFFAGDKNINFVIHLLLVLLLSKQSRLLRENSSKQNLILVYSFNIIK